eukprot:TRINITY_DN5554_c0_g1_i4.p1 TRINITY_DN5554_c0_g1~~TRINITY_DN5554_c0_g1_i4.p1  ORF type:complete len:131 (+),score=4.79 TRINITY_DN5554_c0_g1_i4:64-456(+)
MFGVSRCCFSLSNQSLNLDLIEASLKSRPRATLRSEHKKAGVLLPLCHPRSNPVPSILFTLRSSKVGSHRGQVSFPGGKKDDNDDIMVACAIRETEEEIGFPRGQIRVLGLFDECMSVNNLAGNAEFMMI